MAWREPELRNNTCRAASYEVAFQEKKLVFGASLEMVKLPM